MVDVTLNSVPIEVEIQNSGIAVTLSSTPLEVEITDSTINVTLATTTIDVSAAANIDVTLASSPINIDLGGDPHRKFGLEVVIDGAGSEISTGVKVDVRIPFNCTIQAVTALADQTGSIVVDIWKDTLANYPPENADSITAAAPVTISSDDNSEDTTLTGWTTTVDAGDVLRFNVDSVTTITRLALVLTLLRN